MKYTIQAIMLMLTSQIFGQVFDSIKQPNTKYVVISPSSIDSLTRKAIVRGNSKSFELSKEEINQLDTLVSNCIAYYNLKKDSMGFSYNNHGKNKDSIVSDWGFRSGKDISIEHYKRQYVPYLNKNGEKNVWVNCFREDISNWRKKILIAADGGDNYFNLRVNLNRKKYFDLRVNGM